MTNETLLAVRKGQYAILSEIREGFKNKSTHRVSEDIDIKMDLILKEIETLEKLVEKDLTEEKACVVFFASFEGNDRAAWFKTERFYSEKTAGDLLDWAAIRMQELGEPAVITNLKIIR